MTTTPQRATVILALLFVSSASGEVIFSRRVYKEHGASYQQIWTWNPADGGQRAVLPYVSGARLRARTGAAR
jgi:hypothetical protein